MNFGLLLGLLKGSSVWETVSRVLDIGAGFIAGLDSDNVGDDDLIADVMLTASEGIGAYGRKEFNKVGEIIDSLIKALNVLKQRWVANGRIKVRVPTNEVTA